MLVKSIWMLGFGNLESGETKYADTPCPTSDPRSVFPLKIWLRVEKFGAGILEVRLPKSTRMVVHGAGEQLGVGPENRITRV
jgi:hypothetical protein